MKLGIGLKDVSDWGPHYFSDLFDQARSRSRWPILLAAPGLEAIPEIAGKPITLQDVTLRPSVANVSVSDISFNQTGPQPSARVEMDGPFLGAFRQRLDLFDGSVRLMDWSGCFSRRTGDVQGTANGHTDDTSQAPWSEDQGAPWSYMAEMAAIKPTWVCIPSHAGIEEARAMGRAIGHRAAFPVTVEWSNELWNGTFPQASLVANPQNPGDWDYRLMEALRRSLALVNAFAEGFREVSRQPLDRMFCWQLGSDGGPLWNFRRQPWDGRVVNQAARDLLAQFDGLGVAIYFGHRSDPTPATLMTDVEALRPALDVFKEVCDDIDLVERSGRPLKRKAYEAGQHYSGTQMAVQRSPEMGAATLALLRLAENYVEELCYYVLVGANSPSFGSWGAMEHLNDIEAPKWQALVDYQRTKSGSGNGGGGGGGEPPALEARVVALEARAAVLEAVFNGQQERITALEDTIRRFRDALS